MRIVGGKFKGRALAAPKSNAIRPTSDRARESLFNILAHKSGLSFEGLRVIDLFAGTGALGFEALSRGAAFALFVDEGAEARGLIRRNMEAMQLNGHAKIFRRDATRLGSAGTMAPFDLAFLDPPYRRGFGEKALAALSTGKWLVNGAAVVLEEAQDTAIVVPSEYEVEEIRDYGAAALHLLRYCP